MGLFLEKGERNGAVKARRGGRSHTRRAENPERDEGGGGGSDQRCELAGTPEQLCTTNVMENGLRDTGAEKQWN